MWKGAFILTFGRSSESIVQFIISIAIARLVNLENIGIYKQLFLYSALIILISSFSIPQLFTYFVPRIRIGQCTNFLSWVKKVIIYSFLASIVVTLLFWVILRNQSFGYYFKYLILPFAFLSLATTLLNSAVFIYIANGNQIKAIKTSIWRVIFNIISAVFFIIIIFSPIIYFSVLSVCLLMYATYVFRKVLKENDFLSQVELSPEEDKYYWIYAFSLFGTNISFYFSHNLDKYIVSYFFNDSDYAVYSYGGFQIPFIGILINSIMSVTVPLLVESYHKGEIKRFIDIWNKQIRETSILYILLFFVIFFFSNTIILLFYGEKFSASIPVFQVTMLKYLITITNYTLVCAAIGHPKIALYWSILYISLNLITGLIFIRIFGYIGAAISTSLLFFLSPFFYIFKISKIIGCSWKEVFPVFHYLKVLLICSLIWVPAILLFNTIEGTQIRSLIVYKFILAITLISINIFIFQKVKFINIYSLWRYFIK